MGKIRLGRYGEGISELVELHSAWISIMWGQPLRKELVRCVWRMVHDKEHVLVGKTRRKAFILVGKDGDHI